MSALLAAGTVVDSQFEILCLVGEGGMGQVYKARQIDLDRVVALKVLFPTLISDHDVLNRFEREGKVLAEIEHPNIPKFFKFGVWNQNCPYIAMEYFEGNTLQQLIDSHDASWQSKIQILIEACYAVEYAHKHGFLHRDLKPGNILCIQTIDKPIVKVVDFGLATAIGDRFGELTQSGALVGTIYYISPEQCAGKRSDTRSDIYSLGCILYACLTGSPPFSGNSPIVIMQKHAHAKARRLSQAGARDIPQGFQDLTDQCLSKDPDMRPQSAAKLAAALEELLIRFVANASFGKSLSKSKNLQTAMSFVLAIILLPLIFGSAMIARNHRMVSPKAGTTSKSHHSTNVKFAPIPTLYNAVKFYQEDRRSEAIALLDKFLTEHDSDVRLRELICFAHLQKALVQLEDRQRIALAEQEYEKALSFLPNQRDSRLHCMAYFTVGKIRGKQKAYAEGVNYLGKARALLDAPTGAVPPALFERNRICYWGIDRALSQICEDANDTDLAVPVWRAAIRKNRSDYTAAYGLAHALITRSDLDHASEVVLDGIERHPEEIEWLILWMQLLEKQGRSRAADAIVDRITAFIRKAAPTYIASGQIDTASKPTPSPTSSGSTNDESLARLKSLFSATIRAEMDRRRWKEAYEIMEMEPALAEPGEFERLYLQIAQNASPEIALRCKERIIDLKQRKSMGR